MCQWLARRVQQSVCVGVCQSLARARLVLEPSAAHRTRGNFIHTAASRRSSRAIGVCVCVRACVRVSVIYEPASGYTRLLPLLLHSFNGLFSRTTWLSRCWKGKTSLDLNEARDDGVLGWSGISWTICKQSAPRSRQITTPTPQSSLSVYRPGALPDAQPTVSKLH